jgi:hypothetical protein
MSPLSPDHFSPRTSSSAMHHVTHGQSVCVTRAPFSIAMANATVALGAAAAVAKLTPAACGGQVWPAWKGKPHWVLPRGLSANELRRRRPRLRRHEVRTCLPVGGPRQPEAAKAKGRAGLASERQGLPPKTATSSLAFGLGAGYEVGPHGKTKRSRVFPWDRTQGRCPDGRDGRRPGFRPVPPPPACGASSRL